MTQAEERPDFSFGLVQPCEENVFDFTHESENTDLDGNMNAQDAEQATLLPNSYYGPDIFAGSESQQPESNVQEPAEVEPSTGVIPIDDTAAAAADAEAAAEVARPSTDFIISDIPVAADAAPEMAEPSADVIPSDDTAATADAEAAPGIAEPSTDSIISDIPVVVAAAAQVMAEPSTDSIISDIPGAAEAAPEVAKPSTDIPVAEEGMAEPSTDFVLKGDIASASAAAPEMAQPSTDFVTSNISAEVAEPSTDFVTSDIPAEVVEPSTDFVTSDIPAAADAAQEMAEPSTDVIPSDDISVAEAAAADVARSSSTNVIPRDFVVKEVVQPSAVLRNKEVETYDGHLQKMIATIDGKQSVKFSKCRVSATFELEGGSGALLEVGSSHRGKPVVSHDDAIAGEVDLNTVDMEAGYEVHDDTVADQDQMNRSPSPAAACSERNSLQGSRSPQSGLGAWPGEDSTAPITFASFRSQSTDIPLQRVMNTNEADRALSLARFSSCPIPSSEAGDGTNSMEMGGPSAPMKNCTQDDTNRLALEAFYAVSFPAEQPGIPASSTSVLPLDLAASGSRQNVEARAAAEEQGEKAAVSEIGESEDEDWRPSPYTSDVDDDPSDEARAIRDGGYVDESDSDGEDPYHCLLPPLPPHLVNAPSNIEIGSEEKLDEFIDMLKTSENVENALKTMKEDKAIVNFARLNLPTASL